MNKEFGDPSISELHVPGDQRLQALCKKLLKGFVEMETARRRWRSFPREKEALLLAQQEKAGIRFRTGSEYPNEYTITIFKIKEELIDLRYVYLLKMYRKALSFNVPFEELDPADMQSIQTVLDLANNDYHKFWERYIHLSSQGYANYAHCYTATPDGEIILRPELAPDQLPRMTYPSLRPATLAMGTSETLSAPAATIMAMQANMFQTVFHSQHQWKVCHDKTVPSLPLASGVHSAPPARLRRPVEFNGGVSKFLSWPDGLQLTHGNW